MATPVVGKGKAESELLRANINDQLNRLLTQLEDLEELKDQLEAGEYEEEKKDTQEQLKDFQAFLEKSLAGDMTLTSEFQAAQLAIQAAISQAFKTPEVIRMFANKQPDQLRKRLLALDRESKLRHISQDQYNSEAVDILNALQKLGTKLTSEERDFLEKVTSARMVETAADKIGTGAKSNLMATASSQITAAAT